jgi:2',3'-cyclic-nucleotide 2'-phosphodiesterase (5'-nucleotidase family)
MAEAKFPMLSANAVVTGTEELVAQPYTVRELAGHRIALVGLSGGNGTAEIGVRDPLAAAQKIVPEVRKEADIVILLSHAGQMIDQQIADQVPGIAAIVSGGNGARQAAWESATTRIPVYHADQAFSGHAGRMMGVGKLNFDAGGQLKAQQWQQVPLNPSIADDPTMGAWVQAQINP